ncbi:MAG: ATP synthase F0 subunit B [Oscillospiraceae bacterium]|nr:ATP synthase F0 subunit B [Oscillospiraceae bacterium]
MTLSLPPFGMDFNTVLSAAFNLVNVAVLAVVLAFLLYRPVREVLQKRTERIQKQLSQADDELKQAISLRHEYEQKIEDIEREREEILETARKQASDSSRRLLSEAKAEADTVKERASRTVEMEWERAQMEMRNAIIDVSSVMAKKLVKHSLTKGVQDSMFDETVSELEGMTWRN